MCEYCGCRDIALIGRLSEEHYEAVDALGELRRAIHTGDAQRVSDALDHFSAHLFPHNDSEEAGLFKELLADEYFAPTVTELIEQHRLFRRLVARIAGGEWDAYAELEQTLRRHIDREENGLFPATAVAVDGPTWAEIDRLTRDFNQTHHRERFVTEADMLAERRAAPPAPPVAAAADPGFSLRPATPDDAAELVALWRQCGLVVEDPETVAHSVATVTALRPELVLVATAGDSIVGNVLATWDGRRCWVSRACTRPDRRGQGIATALLAAVEKGVRSLGGSGLTLLMPAEHYQTLGFFEARGYVAADVILAEKRL